MNSNSELSKLFQSDWKQFSEEKKVAIIQALNGGSSFHLRNANLVFTDILPLMNVVNWQNTQVQLTSFSLSYNNLLGDEGIILAIENLPKTITELGLVSCGISRVGEGKVRNLLRDFKSLGMICMEGNG